MAVTYADEVNLQEQMARLSYLTDKYKTGTITQEEMAEMNEINAWLNDEYKKRMDSENESKKDGKNGKRRTTRAHAKTATKKKPEQKKPAPKRDNVVKGDRTSDKEGVIDDFRHIDMTETGVSFSHENADDKTKKDVRTRASKLKENDDLGATYLTPDDYIACIEKMAAQSDKKFGKATVTIDGINGGKPMKVKLKPGKKLTQKQVDKLREDLATHSSLILGAEAHKGGRVDLTKVERDQDGNIVSKEESTVALRKEEREIMTNEGNDTEYFQVGKMSLDEGKAKKIGNSEKKPIPKWVKGVAIAAGVVGAAFVVAQLSPFLLGGLGGLWTAAPAAIQPLVHGVQAGIAGLGQIFGVLNNPVFHAASGLWKVAGGAALNAVAGIAGAVGGFKMAQSAVKGVYRMGAWVGDKVKGLASHISMGRQKTDTRQAAPAAPAPAHESGMEHGA